MRKNYVVTCEVDMCAEKEIKVKVTTNLEHKATKIAQDKLKKDGHFYVLVRKVEEEK